MKKLIGLAIAIALSCATVATGAWAYFGDREQSSNNMLTAGILNLQANGADSVTGTFSGTSAVKCDGRTYTGNITLYNAGSINGTTLGVSVNYTENDVLPNPSDKTIDQTARVIEVTALSCNGYDLLAGVSDFTPTNGYKDVWDVNNTNLTVPGGLGVGQTKQFSMTIKLRQGIDNTYQSDGIDITMTFTLVQ